MKNWTVPSLLGGFVVILLVLAVIKRPSNIHDGNASAPGSTNGAAGANNRRVLHEIFPTLTEITNGSIQFFDRNGKPLLGFVERDASHIKVFSEVKGTSPLGETVAPFDRATLVKLTQLLQEQADIDNRRAQAQADEVIRINKSDELARAAGELAAFQKHYFTDLTKYAVAVLIVDEGQKENEALSYSLARFIGTDGRKTSAAVFTPAFIKEGFFNDMFLGQSDALKRLPLTNATQAIVLGRQSIVSSTSKELSGLLTVTMTLEIKALSADSLQSIFATSVNAAGAGLTMTEARGNAEERVFHQLTNGILNDIAKLSLEKSQ